jgi:hypothetical protein
MNYELYRKKDKTYNYHDDEVNPLPEEILSDLYWKDYRYNPPIPDIGNYFETQEYKITIINPCAVRFKGIGTISHIMP